MDVPADSPATPVILDCDPGHDDAFAILLAAANPRIDLRAITTVAGNQTLDKTSLNARRVCALAGITDVPIAAGCAQPLERELVVAAHVHGETGLDGTTFPDPTVELEPVHAVDLMHEMLGGLSGRTTIVAVGPLTNVATLLRRHPEDAGRIERIVIMGGSTGRGNVMPYAEFNVYVDPEAAAEVLRGGVSTVWHGLNVTHQARATPDVVERIAALATPLAATCVELLRFFNARYRERYGIDGAPVHDPVAVAHVIDPTVVTGTAAPMQIEVESEITRGATVIDLDHRTSWGPPVHVATTLDQQRFWDMLIDAIDVLGRRRVMASS